MASNMQGTTYGFNAKKIGILFDGPQEFDCCTFMFFVLCANKIQSEVLFLFPDTDESLSFVEAHQRYIANKKICKCEADVYVFITAKSLHGNYFFEQTGSLLRVTTDGWSRNFSPPSLFEYLFHSILCGVIHSLSRNVIYSHRDYTIGCQFDFTRIKSHDRIDIATGYICEKHKNQIETCFGKNFLDTVSCLFSFSWLGSVEDQNSVAFKMKDLFSHDLRADSGYKKNFWERTQTNIDALGFDFAKEIFKGLILIVTAFFLIKFGLKAP